MSVTVYNVIVTIRKGGFMARPKKSRFICSYPKSMEFRPFGEYAETIDLSFDEYEAFRLIDHLKYSQEECAKQMDVARSTVASIYETARTKIADSIINGKAVAIHGGDVRLCPNRFNCCGKCGQNKCGNCNHGSCPKCKSVLNNTNTCDYAN